MQTVARCNSESADGASSAHLLHESDPGLTRSILLNIAGLGGLWVLYSVVRNITADSWGVATEHARWLIQFQDRVGLPSEAVFQSVFLDHEWFLRAANVFYLGAHFPSIFIFLAWGMIWQRDHLPRIRWALIGSTAAGLMIHLAFPLAPPRLLRFSGFVDTASVFGPDPYALGVTDAANELAAMPSMHVGWALLISLFVVQVSTSRWRWLVLLHPIVTTIVVVVTANHYWTDVFVGAILAACAWWLVGRRFVCPPSSVVVDLVEDAAEETKDKEIGLL